MGPITPLRAVLALLFLLPAATTPARAQSDTLGLHTTLAGWADDALLHILDRDAARGGRLSDRGILQRFWFDIDPDYQINLMRMRFDLVDDDEWSRHASGVRYWSGSINTRDEAIEAEFKARVQLADRWSADVNLRHQSLLELTRSLVRLRVRHTAGSGVYTALEGAFSFHKPSSDVGFVAGWQRGNNQIEIALTALDAFNNFIYGGLKVENTPADTALDYQRQPFLLHAQADLSLGPRWRIEGRAGVMRPTTVRAFVQAVPDSGFLQDERYGYAGVLAEWLPSNHMTASGFATVIRAVTNRTPLPNGGPVNDYRLTERTAELGGSLLVRPAPRWLLEGWLGRSWRPEGRVYRSGAAPDVNYEDVAWSGQAVVMYRPAQGFTSSLALDLDDRSVVRGDGEVPSHEPLTRHNSEIRFDFGWRFPNRSLFDLGLGFDLDPGIYPRGWFGGAHGRFVLYW